MAEEDTQEENANPVVEQGGATEAMPAPVEGNETVSGESSSDGSQSNIDFLRVYQFCFVVFRALVSFFTPHQRD